jgi:hypothetical protein
MVNTTKKNISDEIDEAVKVYEDENKHKPSYIILDDDNYTRLLNYCRDHYMGEVNQETLRLNDVPVLKNSNIKGIKLVDSFTPILLNELLEDTLTKNDIHRIDKIRSDWFGGFSNKTPLEVLNSIPSDIKFLINCINKLHTENLEIKGNLS